MIVGVPHPKRIQLGFQCSVQQLKHSTACEERDSPSKSQHNTKTCAGPAYQEAVGDCVEHHAALRLHGNLVRPHRQVLAVGQPRDGVCEIFCVG